jgi:hypothetical protein
MIIGGFGPKTEVLGEPDLTKPDDLVYKRGIGMLLSELGAPIEVLKNKIQDIRRRL